MTEREQIAAINAEARRRGSTYGKLAPQLSRMNEEKIYRAYEREREKKAKRSRKKA